jgi:hypothetical protein
MRARSAATAAALVAATAALVAATGATPRTAPTAAAPAAAPAVRYADVTTPAGIDFVHRHGGSGRKYYVESSSAGTCWFDYDGDGWQDLYYVQSGPLPGAPRPPDLGYSKLYRNRRDGTFEDVTGRTGVANAAGYGSGCGVADYDNDGDEDLYVTNFGPSVLYRNNGDGTFADVTEAAGVKNGLYAASAGWADYDLDGRPDLYVSNYVDFTMNDQKYCGDIRVGRRSYCHPDAYDGLPDALYHNDGNGRFSEVSRAAGIWDPLGKSFGVVWLDFDRDGDDDLYVANDATPNRMYRNDGSGRFTDITLVAGVCCSEDGRPQSGMGVDAADYDNDGWQDLVVTNLSNEPTELYRNLAGKGPFAIVSYPAGLAEPGLLLTKWGVAFTDIDNDSDLDLVMTNGHPMDDIEQVSDIMTYAQPPSLFENDGKGAFREIGARAGAFFQRPDTGRGLAVADYDNDGDVDFTVSANGRRATLLRNDGGNTAGHWVSLRLVGTRVNRNALGAMVTVTAGGRTQVREVRASSSFMSQNDMRLHFGLAGATRVDRIEVRWPGREARVERLGPVPAGQFLTIREGAGIVERRASGR